MSIFKCSDCGYCFSDPQYRGDVCVCGETINLTGGIDLSQIMTGGKFFEELFKEKLKALCLQYDYINGIYPESFYQGKAMYEFYQYLCGDETKLAINHDYDNWIKEAYEKFAEEKGES